MSHLFGKFQNGISCLSPLITIIHVFSHNKANNPNMPDCGKVSVSNKQRIPFWNLLKFQVLLFYIIYSSLPFLFCDIGVQISTEDTFIHPKSQKEFKTNYQRITLDIKPSMLPFFTHFKRKNNINSSLIWLK